MTDYIRKFIGLTCFLLVTNSYAAYNCTTNILGVSQTNYAFNFGAFDPLIDQRIPFGAINLAVTCARTQADSRRTETLAVTATINGGSSGNQNNRWMNSTIPGSNLYNYHSDAAYTVPWTTVAMGNMAFNGNFLAPDTNPRTVTRPFYLTLSAFGVNDIGTFQDTVTVTINIGARFTFTNTITLAATYNPNCLFITQNPSMNFGALQATSTPNSFAQQTTPVTIRCTKNTPVSVGITAGSSGNEAARTMIDTATGTQSIPYQLSRNAGHTLPFGNSAPNRITGNGTGGQQNFTIFGRVPLNQLFETPGAYTDSPQIIIQY